MALLRVRIMYIKKELLVLLEVVLPYSCFSSAQTFVQNGGNTVWGNISSWNSNDQIDINATENATYAPLQGYGLSIVTGTLENLVFNIKTDGFHADGIRQNNAQTKNSTLTPYGVLTLGDKLSIVTTGISADGINMSITNSSILNVGNNATISTADGVGVRSNLSKVTNG